MPSVKPGSKVLVTGASGFIATWVIKGLLEKGFYVRGAVRSASKGNFLVNLFKEHHNRFEYVIVEDMAKEHAFDEVVKGVDAVEHTSSAVTLTADHPDEVMIPAITGTLSVLESVLTHGTAVQRVVLTSSCSAVHQPAAHPHTLDEKTWNEFSIQEVKDKGRDASSVHQYRASKTLAEKSAWEFVEKRKGDITWDLTILLPSWVMGPTIHEVSSPASLNTSISYIYDLIKGRQPISATPVGGYIDVRDVVTAHVNALTTENAGGQRIIISAGPYTWQDMFDAIHCEARRDPALSALPKGTPGAGKDVIYPVIYDSMKAQRVLGSTFIDFMESAQDTAKSLLEREKVFGW